jgi:CRISPR-associated endonuclease/helicase Cas3
LVKDIAVIKQKGERIMSDALKTLFPYQPTHVPHDLDLAKLFDTTADLTGGDIDIADWVRGGDELDVYVFWRDIEANANLPKKLKPRHEELCPVSIGDFKNNWKEIAKRKDAAIWRQVYNKGWEKLSEEELIYPGQVFLLNKRCHCYSIKEGWKTDATEDFDIDPAPDTAPGKKATTSGNDTTGDPNNDEDSPEAAWQSIFTHSQKVWKVLADQILKDPAISGALTDSERQALIHTPPWHDYGKAHEKFLAKLTSEGRETWKKEQNDYPAKAPNDQWKSNFSYDEDNKESDVQHKRRPGFRHELASALGLLELIKGADPGHRAVSLPEQMEKDLREAAPHAFPDSETGAPVGLIPDEVTQLSKLDSFTLDLLLYLIASHHGKVRMGLTSTDSDHETNPRKNPDPPDPANPKRRIRGVQDDDKLPACRLPSSHNGKDSFTTPEITLDLSLAEMFSARYGRSWRERTSGLLAVHGPFRLAYLEALIRAADARGSDE